jgi:hypothetical protein
MYTIKNKVQQVFNSDHHEKLSGKGKTVLITGGSGFVAAHVLNSFLSRGYNVRITVRSAASAEKVQKSHSKYLSQLSFAIVPDVQTPGGHDEAVRGVDGVSITCRNSRKKENLETSATDFPSGDSHCVTLRNVRREQRTRSFEARYQRHNLRANLHPRAQSLSQACSNYLLLHFHRQHGQRSQTRIHIYRERLESRHIRRRRK